MCVKSTRLIQAPLPTPYQKTARYATKAKAAGTTLAAGLSRNLEPQVCPAGLLATPAFKTFPVPETTELQEPQTSTRILQASVKFHTSAVLDSTSALSPIRLKESARGPGSNFPRPTMLLPNSAKATPSSFCCLMRRCDWRWVSARCPSSWKKYSRACTKPTRSQFRTPWRGNSTRCKDSPKYSQAVNTAYFGASMARKACACGAQSRQKTVHSWH